MTQDFYRVLGLTPDADQVVIAAAYRALAAKFHPDRWTGDPKVSNERMAELNVAYETLRDPFRRAAYDSTRPQQSAWSEEDAETAEAFCEALENIEERWGVATSVFPEMQDIRKSLAQTSTALSFAFVEIVLETKRFKDARKIANELESSFLRRYFGEDARILAFARHLISGRHRQAVKALNKLVDVLGSSVDASVIIGRVSNQFGLQVDEKPAGRRVTVSEQKMQRIRTLRPLLMEQASAAAAIEIAMYLQYRVDVSGAFSPKYTIQDLQNGKVVMSKAAHHIFMRWAQDALS